MTDHLGTMSVSSHFTPAVEHITKTEQVQKLTMARKI